MCRSPSSVHDEQKRSSSLLEKFFKNFPAIHQLFFNKSGSAYYYIMHWNPWLTILIIKNHIIFHTNINYIKFIPISESITFRPVYCLYFIRKPTRSEMSGPNCQPLWSEIPKCSRLWPEMPESEMYGPKCPGSKCPRPKCPGFHLTGLVDRLHNVP